MTVRRPSGTPRPVSPQHGPGLPRLTALSRQPAGSGPTEAYAASAPALDRRDSWLLEDGGVRFVFAAVVLGVALRVGSFFGAPVATATALLVVVLCGVGVPWPWRAGMALVAWALLTGFVVNQLGELTFHHADLLRLIAFLVAGVGVRKLLGVRS